jgi:hypothetical protein
MASGKAPGKPAKTRRAKPPTDAVKLKQTGKGCLGPGNKLFFIRNGLITVENDSSIHTTNLGRNLNFDAPPGSACGAVVTNQGVLWTAYPGRCVPYPLQEMKGGGSVPLLSELVLPNTHFQRLAATDDGTRLFAVTPGEDVIWEMRRP